MNDNFYITGGTLPLDSDSYVTRQADTELLDGLRRGEFCYVLNTRQMGKSSLMVRTAHSLRQEGCRVIVLDLTAIGQNLTVEQWYFGLVARIGQQTDTEDELFAFWAERREMGPMQKFVEALRHVLLKPGKAEETGGATCDRLVLFVDEIDAVRSLSFSTDEFFAGIRECYNRRASDPAFNALTFCLLGVATPSDLIQDTRVSPFNIGRRIELRDFTDAEAEPLAAGLTGTHREQGTGNREQGGEKREYDAYLAEITPRALRLLRRILHWTNGHPYMTQRLCRAVAESLAKEAESGEGDELDDQARVDSLCQTLFLSKTARESDDNLTFARNRLLRSEVDLAALLELYLQALGGRRTPDDETNPLRGVLRLSGVVTAEKGALKLRNRIYAQVFDKAWAMEQMPGAELRRQKRAYRRGILRSAAVFGSLAMVIGALLFVAVGNSRRARRAEKEAVTQTEAAARLLYDADINLTQRQWESKNFTQFSALLDETKESKSRGFEWDYWNRLRNEYAPPLPMTGPRWLTLISPDGLSLAELSQDETAPDKARLTVRDRVTGAARFSVLSKPVRVPVDYAPDSGRLLLTSGRTMEIRDAQNGLLLQTIPARRAEITACHFTADGKGVFVADAGGMLALWDCAAEKIQWERKIAGGNVYDMAVCGARLATRSDTASVQEFLSVDRRATAGVWDAKTGKEIYRNERDFAIGSIAFSPDGAILAGRARSSGLCLLDWRVGKMVKTPDNRLPSLADLHFSPDGRRLLASYIGSVCLYDVPTGRRLSVLLDRVNGIPDIRLSPDGRFGLYLGDDSKIHFLSLTPQSPFRVLRPPIAAQRQGARSQDKAQGQPPLWRIHYSPDGSEVATASSDGAVRLWDAGTGRLRRTLPGLSKRIRATTAVFSHDGRRIAVGADDGAVSLWDLRSGRRLFRFRTQGKAVNKTQGEAPSVNDLCFTPDDRQLLTAGNDAMVKIWDLPPDGRAAPFLHSTLAGHVKEVESVALSPDGETILTGGDDLKAMLWERRSGRPLKTFPAPREVWGAAFSPDGRRIAVSNLSNTVEIWDVAAGKQMSRLVGHQHWVTDVVFSPDGRRILTGSKDNTAKLWDAETGRELLTLRGHRRQVIGVAFSPNGRQIATASADGDARLWDADARPPEK